MNADDFLERLWTDVINAVDPALDMNWAHVARLARYEAVFAWCNAHDEEAKRPAWWLARKTWPVTRYSVAAAKRPPVVRDPNEPFVDAARAWKTVIASGASPKRLAEHLDKEAAAALTGVRKLLATFAKQKPAPEPEDLFGLHEAVLSANPSRREARRGSWPEKASSKSVTRGGANSGHPNAGSPKAGPLLRVKRAHELALSPEGTHVIAAVGGDITHLVTGKVIAKCAVLANTSYVTWSPDGNLIAATSTSGAIALCDAKTGARKRVLRMSREGCAPVFSADSRLLFCGDWDGNLVAWNVATGRAASELKLPGTMITDLSPTARGVVALVTHKPVPVEIVTLSSTLKPQGKRIKLNIGGAIVYDAKNERVLACGLDKIQWCQLKTGTLSKPHPFDGARHIALSPDGAVFVATVDGGFRVGKTDALGRSKFFERKYASGRASFSSDARRVTLATWEGGEVWDVAALFAG